MAETAVRFLLNQLSTLLFQEMGLLEELRPNVEFIKHELGSMTAFLRDAEAMQDPSLEIQEWVQQVREVAYDVEDVLDDFSFHFARHLAGRLYCGMQNIYRSIKAPRTRHRISSEIKIIKARVENISAMHQRYQSIFGVPARASSDAITGNADYDIRTTSLLIEEAKLVGIDKPKRELVSQILDDEPRLKVISVLGMGGLGKTTLVREVYDDAAVKKQYQSHAWLTISQTFQVMVFVKALIQQLLVEIKESVPLEMMECKDVIRLGEFVKNFLQDRRMEPLSGKESWTLFCHRIFRSSHCPPHLEDVSRLILKKCQGLPLAIVAICGVLALKDKGKIDEWKKILDSLEDEIEGGGKLDQIRKILLLSYNDLPHYLKSCLLYLCILPEDYVIGLDGLIHKWTSQGFVQEKNGISALDIGRRYANELVNRSLIQFASTSTEESIRVHDFLREIIAQKSKEQNFGALATGYYPIRSVKVRRLAICDFVDNAESQELNDCLKSLRSLEFFGDTSLLSASVLAKVLRGCSKRLKMLDLGEAALGHLPGKVFKLFHLNYLCFRNTAVRTIPKSIGKLQNLEFLNFFGTEVAELPVEILMLRKLRTVEGGGYLGNFTLQGFKVPRGIGKLLSLESLGVIEANDKEIVREIGKLTKLRVLHITKLKREDGKEFLSSLQKLTNLEGLMVVSINEDQPFDLQHSVSPTPSSLEAVNLMGHLGTIPQWIISLHGLTFLSLKDSGLKEDDVMGGLEALQVLPNLTFLYLHHAYEGETLYLKAGGFQKLKELHLTKLERLKWVMVEENSMPSLQILRISECEHVQELPIGIENLTKLKRLQLNDMSDELIEKVKILDKRSEEYQKLAHIPEVVIGYWINDEWEATFL